MCAAGIQKLSLRNVGGINSVWTFRAEKFGLFVPFQSTPIMSANPSFRWEFASGPSDGFFKNPPLLPNLVPRRQLCASESSRDFTLIHRQFRQLELLTPSAARAKAIWKSYQPRYLRLWLRPHWLQWWCWTAGQSLTNSSWQRPKLCPKCGTFISLHLNKSMEVCLKLPVGGGGMCRWPL